jgi:hypothetical protein
MLLVDDFLGRLIAIESKASTCTFHDDGRTEATEDASLVVLGRVQACNDYVVRIKKVRLAGGA